MIDNNEIHIDITLASDDFVEFQRYHLRNLNVFASWLVLMMVSFLLILLHPPFWYFFLPGSVVFVAVTHMLRNVVMRSRFRRDFKRDYISRKEYSLTITEAGITQTSASSTSFFGWSEVRRAHKNGGIYRLYIARSQAILIPVRSLASATDREAFERLVSVKVPDKGSKLAVSAWPFLLINGGIGTVVICFGALSGILLTSAMEPKTEIASPIPSKDAAAEQKMVPLHVNLPEKRSFKGEDAIWEIPEFDVLEQEDGFRITPGSFRMKGTDQYYTDYRKAIIYMTLDRGPVALIESELEQPNTNIANLELGPSGFTYYKNNRLPVKMADISELYVEILWRDNGTGVLKTSRIDLYSESDSNPNNQEQESEEEDLVNPEVRKGDDLGQFIATSWKSPNLVNIIELREVQIADKDYATRSNAQQEARASVRFYYGQNGGILDQFVHYDHPGGYFELEDFEVIWENDWEATVNAFAADGTIDESFNIQIAE